MVFLKDLKFKNDMVFKFLYSFFENKLGVFVRNILSYKRFWTRFNMI